MRPFYIIKNKHGFYSVSFVNQTTGKRTAWKSTHTSDYSEAMLIASTWYKDGSPSEQARTALRLSKQENKSSGIDVEKLIARLTVSEAKLLYIELAAKFGASIPVLNTTSTPVVESAPINELPVEEPAPKKKVVVVHKKNAIADSGLLPEDVAQKVYEPLNPDCTIKLFDFLRNFWTPEKSEYIKNKRAHNKSIGDYHCKEMYNMVNRYWLPFFGEDFTVGELTEQYLEDFLQELANFRHLKGATINHARTCGATALKWLKNKKIIHSDPMANVEAFSKSDATLRGIPTEEDKRMIHYFNKACFFISDKKYILCVTEVLFEALGMYFKMKIVMFLTRTKQLFRPDLLITMGIVNNDIYLCRGALNVAKALNADVFELEKYFA